MSDDIAERLRKRAYRLAAKDFNGDGAKLAMEAADEITRLRADLAAVTAERDRMRQRINSMIVMLEMAYNMIERPTHSPLDVGFRHSPLSQKEIIQRLTETCLFVRADLSKTIDEARAAIESVTEPASPWRDIESAPRDGTWIFIYKDSWHGAIKAKWDAIDGVDSPFMAWVFQDEFLCIGCAEGCLGYNEDIEDGYMPTHWMPLPEPPR